MAREIINTEKAPAAIGPYVQAVADNGLLFISGQLGFDVEHGSVIPETVEEQATLSLKNLDAIMTAASQVRLHRGYSPTATTMRISGALR